MSEPTIVKEKLRASTERHRQAFENELENLGANIDRAGKTLLWVGGGLVLGYQIYKLLKRRDSQEDKAQESPQGLQARQQKQSITQSLMDELALYLLGIVKKKLLEFLEKNTDGSIPVQNDTSTK